MIKCPQQSTASAAAQTPRSLLELQAVEARRLGLVFSHKPGTLLGSKTKGFKGRAVTWPTAGNYHVSKQRLCLGCGGKEESFAAAELLGALCLLLLRTEGKMYLLGQSQGAQGFSQNEGNLPPLTNFVGELFERWES